MGVIIGAIINTFGKSFLKLLQNRIGQRRNVKQLLHAPVPLSPQQVRMDRIRRALAFLMCGASFLFAAFAIYLCFSFIPNPINPCPPFAQMSVVITSPQKGDKVDHNTLVKGNACNIPQGHFLWLVLTSVNYPNVHYLQNGPMDISNGEWFRNIFVGDEALKSAKFGYSLNAIVVDQTQNAMFQTMYKKPASQRKFSQFPPNIEFVANVFIVLK